MRVEIIPGPKEGSGFVGTEANTIAPGNYYNGGLPTPNWMNSSTKIKHVFYTIGGAGMNESSYESHGMPNGIYTGKYSSNKDIDMILTNANYVGATHICYDQEGWLRNITTIYNIVNEIKNLNSSLKHVLVVGGDDTVSATRFNDGYFDFIAPMLYNANRSYVNDVNCTSTSWCSGAHTMRGAQQVLEAIAKRMPGGKKQL